MSQDLSLIDVFLSVSNSLPALVGLLTSNDSNLQVEAAWCITNLSAGSDHHCNVALKASAPYLITYLDGQNIELKDHCCWALGNMAANGTECQTMLQRLGLLTPLVNIIMTCSYSPQLMQSALFAMANMMSNNEICSGFPSINVEFISRLLHFQRSQLNIGGKSGTVLEICRLLFHISCSSDKHSVMLSTGVFSELTDVLVQCFLAADNMITIITPLIRCLGNLAFQPDDFITSAVKDGRLVKCLSQLLQTGNVPFFLQKEVLWVLNNVTVVSAAASQQCMDNNLHTYLVGLLHSQPGNVQLEIVTCLLHLLNHDVTICSHLIDSGLITNIGVVMKRAETEPTELALCLLEQILQIHSEVKPVCEKNEIVSTLESLTFSSDPRVQARASDILQVHWGHV